MRRRPGFLFALLALLAGTASLLPPSASAQESSFTELVAMGGPEFDLARDVVIDQRGRIYVLGSFRGTADFGGGVELTSAGDADVFIAKYENGAPLWILHGAGPDFDRGHVLALDSQGHLLAGGQFRDSVSFGAVSLGGPSTYGAFLLKIDPDGAIVWATEATSPTPGGGPESGGTAAYDLAVDATDHVVVSGAYIESLTVGPFTLPNGGANEEGFVARFDSDGNALWAQSFPGSYQVFGRGVDVDAAGDVYLTGSFGHHNFGGTGVFGSTTLTSAGGRDIFLARLDAAVGDVDWVRQAGSSATDAQEGGFDLVTDDFGTSTVVGAFRGSASFGGETLVSQGDHDAFLATWADDGTLLSAHAFGGTGRDHAESVSADGAGRVAVTGFFEATLDLGIASLVSAGGRDAYVARIETDDGSVHSALRAGGTGRDEGTGINVDDAGRLTLAGRFEATADFGSGSLTSAGDSDGFLAAVRAVPELRMPLGLGAAGGESVAVPVSLLVGGLDISSVALSIDYDESCLDFDPTDSDSDGLPDALTILAPAPFDATAFVDPGDADGEIDLLVSDFPPDEILPSGDLAVLQLSTREIPSCDPEFGEIVTAPVAFSLDPSPSFGNTAGESVPGLAWDGSIEILPGDRGDVNADDLVDAGDVAAIGLEVFDGDGVFWRDVPGGSFPGSPVGSDANVDTLVDAGDLSCIGRLIFGLSCAPPPAFGGVEPAVVRLAVAPRSIQTIVATLELLPKGNAVNSLALSLDLDTEKASLDDADRDGDGVPDAIVFTTSPPVASAQVDLTDERGEIDLLLADLGAALDEGTLVEVELTLLGGDGTDSIRYSTRPRPSFGDLSGRSVPGRAMTLLFASGFESGNTDEWSTTVP